MIEKNALQKYSMFGGLTAEQIEQMMSLISEVKFTPGEMILTEGTPNDRILFILDGKVSVMKGDTVIYILSEGNSLGEMDVLDIMPSAASVKAETEVKMMVISSRSLREIYRTDTKMFCLLLMNFARDLSRRLRIADDIMAGNKMFDAYTSRIFHKRPGKTISTA